MPASTANKEKIVPCIRKFLNENGYPPSLREICAITGINSPSTVNSYITQLINEGSLKRNGNARRCVIPIDYKFNESDSPITDNHRVKLVMADGGALELDYSVTTDANRHSKCTFEGILDCSRIKSRVSRIVACKTEE